MSKVCFGDIVRDVKINVDRTSNPYDYYVAGDHMDTEELRILRRGRFSEPPEPGPAFTRVFKPGQILYGSRRTYLKKVAVADFEGVCANTTFVLETKDDNVFLQQLLPFLMYSEKFTQYSINNSKGSTNPYILFSDLAKYEFDLPPITKQRKLADLLWALNTTREAYKKLLNLTDKIVKSRFVEMFGEGLKDDAVELSNVCQIITDGTHQPPKFTKSGIPFLFVSNIVDNEISFKTGTFISREDYEVLIKRTPIEPNDIILTTVGSYGNPAIVRSNQEFCFQRHIAYMKPIQSIINSIYLHAALLSNTLKNQIESKVKGIAQKTLNLSELKTIRLNLPPLYLQNRFAEFARQADKSKFEIQRTIDALETTYKSILRENLG